MPIEILMPALSPTMNDGNLIKWCKNEGDTIDIGDIIAEIETDKATMEFEAVDGGRLAKIIVPEGTQAVTVNTPIALLLEEDEDEDALSSYGKLSQSESHQPEISATTSQVSSIQTTSPSKPKDQQTIVPTDGRIIASPLARRMAKTYGYDLSTIQGSGPNGRIIKSDILTVAEKQRTSEAVSPTVSPSPSFAETAPRAAPLSKTPDPRILIDTLGMSYDAVPHTMMRTTIARRLTEAQTVPHFYLTIDCRIDSLLQIRADLNGRSDEYKISVNDFIIRAAALALQKVPEANAAWSDQAILRFHHADIAVAVSVPGGLITPIVKKAETKGLALISNTMRELSTKARAGQLKPEEYTGGTFSVSNLGMYGIRDFAAVLNPPQGCILAVGAGEKRPVVTDQAIDVATIMTCTLSIDHRVIDGVIGAQFLAVFKKLVEDPLSMLL